MIPSAKKLLMSISSPPFAGFCYCKQSPVWASSMVLGCKYKQIF